MAHCYSNSGSVVTEGRICDPQANVCEQPEVLIVIVLGLTLTLILRANVFTNACLLPLAHTDRIYRGIHSDLQMHQTWPALTSRKVPFVPSNISSITCYH